MRHFLERRRVRPDELDFRVMAPVSVRARRGEGKLGNRVSSWIVPLPLGETDPRDAARSDRAATEELKESKQAVGVEVLTRSPSGRRRMLLSLGARNTARLLPFNMVVTNVPGPAVPAVHAAGATLLETYPARAAAGRHSDSAIALLSATTGKLFWGFNADYDVVPDLEDFVEGTRDALAELLRAARPAKSRRREPHPTG